MRTVTKKEMNDFILSQDDDRELSMGNSANNDGPGCFMVQFGREQNMEFERCNNVSWLLEDEEVAVLEEGANWLDWSLNPSATTYGELKAYINV